MKKLLSIALCLIAVSGFAQKGKTKMAADFYGVDYSCVSVVGANEQPAEFIKAFEAINRLFLSEPKKYDVAGFTGIDILSTNVEQANEALGGLAAEQFTPRSTKADIAAQLPGILARYDNGSGNKGLVLIATTLDKGNGIGYYTAVLFDPATQEVILQMDMAGKPGGFGLRNYWAGSVYNALKKQGKYLTREGGVPRTDTPRTASCGVCRQNRQRAPGAGTRSAPAGNPVCRRIKTPGRRTYPAAPERASGHLPGGGYFMRASSSTSTQSFPLPQVGGVKVIVAPASRRRNSPIRSGRPLRTSYHQATIRFPETRSRSTANGRPLSE